MQYDPNKWPACWILELIAQDRLHEFYTSGLWLRARARALRNQHRECQRCKAGGLIVIEGDRREDGSVVEYGWCPPSYTAMKPDGVYVYCTVEGDLPYEASVALGQRRQREVCHRLCHKRKFCNSDCKQKE